MSSLAAAVPELESACQPFPPPALPFELLSKILSYTLPTHNPIDLDPRNYLAGRKRLHLFLVSRSFHQEASTIFYSTHTFRIFPTHGRFFGPKTLPLLARLPTKYRKSLTSLDLRLGPGWGDPPKSWKVDGRLGLEEMANVRTLKVLVECDPSHDVFRGHRKGRDFFTDFSANLLQEIIDRLPALAIVEFDSWPSVKREGPLMQRLVGLVKGTGKQVVEVSEMRSFQIRMNARMSSVNMSIGPSDE